MSRAEGSGIAALLEDYRRFAGARLWRGLALMALGALAEGFGLLMLVPLVSIAIGSELPAIARLAPWAATFDAGQRFAAALGLFLGAMAARSALLYARDLSTGRLQSDYEASLRLRTAATLARRGWAFASSVGQAGLQSLLLNDVPRAGLAIAFFQQAAIAAIMLAVQLLLAAILSPALTALAFALLVVGAALSVRWLRRGVVSGMAISETAKDSATSGFRLHAGLKAALAQGTVTPFLDEYRLSLNRATAQLVRYTRDSSAARHLAALGAAVAAAFLLLVGIRVLALPLPVLITSLVLFARTAAPAQQLQGSAQSLAAYAPSFAAIVARLGRLDNPPPADRRAEPLDWQELRADALRFAHRPGLGLEPTDVRLRRGEWLGVEGPSGSGKTTLADLIAGLLDSQGGRVTVDGRALDHGTLDRWRASLAYVGQHGSLFDDSVRGNLLADGAMASDRQLWDALDAVGLGERIRALPGGLDERLGDRGTRLSGGEAQRLAIARAWLRNASLLILDEATSALDSASEDRLFDRLQSLDPRPAAIVVAHRPSTLAHCDSVLTIQHSSEEKSAN
jgi:ATP-binding cassette subfamily C protein